MNILEEIFAHKRVEVDRVMRLTPPAVLERRVVAAPVPPDFIAALRDQRHPAPRLIAEVKHRSPSKGVLCANFDPLLLARTYAENGAAAISVLTDERFFGGSLEYLRQIADMGLGMPLLRKDFIFDRYQLMEARAAGASAALLIVAMLDDDQLAGLIAAAVELKLTPLVEVHSLAELQRAVDAGAPVIGVNNRDLKTFKVSLETTFELRSHLPAEIPLVSESGIHSLADIQALADAGVDAILVGEALVTADDTAAATRQLSRITAEERQHAG